MAALTQDRDTPKKHTAFRIVGPVAAATKIYAGSIVRRNATGYFVPGSDTASHNARCYRAVRTVDNTDGANGDLSIEVEAGIFAFGASAALIAAAIANLDLVTATVLDDQTFGLAADSTNDVLAASLVEIDTANSLYYFRMGF